MIIFNEFMKKKLVFSYEITRGCNLRCPYCYASDFLNNKEKYNKEVAHDVIESFRKFKEENKDYTLELDLLGGDPLFCPDIFNFLDEFLPLGIDTWIVSNIVPKDQTKIIKLKEYLDKHSNLGVSCTWHDVCDEELWKKNMLFLNASKKKIYQSTEEIYIDNVIGSLVLCNSESTFDKYSFIKENNISYGITHLFDINNLKQRGLKYNDFTDEIKEVYKNSINYKKIKFTFGDEKLSMYDIEERELYLISHQYNLVCHVLNYNIDFNGNVFNSCFRFPKINYSIKDGIKNLKLVCKDTFCNCSVGACKELYTKRTTYKY